MTNWQDAQHITRAEYDAMSSADKKLIEFDPNKWQFEWETDRYFNAYHPSNEEWLMMRQAAEARGYNG
jgi:hypothetical protein